MPVRKEDEIMENTSLKEGKCSKSPVKSVDARFLKSKGKTLCVVCAENATGEKPGIAPAAEVPHEHNQECSCGEHNEESCEGGLLTDELAMTIVSLCERIQNEKDPDNVLALMNAVKAGTEALKILCQL